MMRKKQMLAVGSSTFLYTMGTGAIWFVLPIFANSIFNNIFIAASIVGVPNFVSLMLNIPLGKLSDRVGRKKLILAGMTINVLLGLALPGLQTIWEFVLFLVAMGFANLLILVPSRAFVMEIAPRRKTSETFGIFETLIELGFAIGPVIGGYLVAEKLAPGVQYAGLFSAIACAISIGVILLLAKETVARVRHFPESIRSLISKDWVYAGGIRDFGKLESAGIAVLIATFIFVFIDGITWAIEPLYTTIGIGADEAGLVMAMFVLPFILFQVPAGKLADQYGKKRVFGIGVAVAALALLGFGIAGTDITKMMALAFVSTSGLAAAIPAIDGLLTDISAKKERGGIVGVWDMAEDSAYIISPVIGGLIAQAFGIGVTFVFLGALLALGLPLMWRLMPARVK